MPWKGAHERDSNLMLKQDYWLTPAGAFDMKASEHAQAAAHSMLNMPADRRVPMHWMIKGIPEEELVAALERGADPKAVEFLSNSRGDPRLFALREYGWIRVAKNAFNLWKFDEETVKLIRNAKDYWAAQDNAGACEMMDVEEFSTGDRFTVSAARLLAGGRPSVLRKLSGAEAVAGCVEKVAPQYSARYGEIERDRLYRRAGGNPRRRR